jgi:hypothetical protein
VLSSIGENNIRMQLAGGMTTASKFHWTVRTILHSSCTSAPQNFVPKYLSRFYDTLCVYCKDACCIVFFVYVQ